MNEPVSTPQADPFQRIRRGLLELAVLSTLAPGRQYAAEILESLEDTPFATQEGTLYPLLGKLRRDGLLEHEWVESDTGPPRKYHQLTDAGTERRTQLMRYWRELDETFTRLGAAR
jgi:PadR family transcriptional regulator PadR